MSLGIVQYEHPFLLQSTQYTHLHKKSEHKSRHNTTYLNLGNEHHGCIIVFVDNVLNMRLNLGLMRSKLRDEMSIDEIEHMEDGIDEKWYQGNYNKSDVCCVTTHTHNPTSCSMPLPAILLENKKKTPIIKYWQFSSNSISLK